jgi:hypothetical protein
LLNLVEKSAQQTERKKKNEIFAEFSPSLAAILIGGLNKVAFAPSTVISKVDICGIGKNRVETHLPPIQKEINKRKRSTAGIQNCIPPEWSYKAIPIPS